VRLGGLWRGPAAQFVRQVFRQFDDDQGWVLSGHLAYSAMLAFMPFMIFATALAGFAIGPEHSRAAVDFLFASLPEHAARTLEPVLREVLGERRGGVLTLSALGAVWAASNGIEAVRIALDAAYDVDRGRHMALNRVFAVALVLIGFVIFIILAAAIVLAPIAFHFVEQLTGQPIPPEADLVRYAIGLGVLWLALWVTHRVLPSRRMAGYRLWPGILTSVALWSLAATGLSAYLAYSPQYALTYGTLTGVMVTLLFFYLTGVALILGAEVNSVVNAEAIRRANERRRAEAAARAEAKAARAKARRPGG